LGLIVGTLLSKVTLLSKDWLSTKVFLDFPWKSENAGYARWFTLVGFKNKHTHPTVHGSVFSPKNFTNFQFQTFDESLLVFCWKPVFRRKSDFHWKCSDYENGPIWRKNKASESKKDVQAIIASNRFLFRILQELGKSEVRHVYCM
jgi:hypothetical protein